MDGSRDMPRNYYILRDDRNWWAVSDGPYIPEEGSSYGVLSIMRYSMSAAALWGEALLWAGPSPKEWDSGSKL
jgi:hypothetical protein